MQRPTVATTGELRIRGKRARLARSRRQIDRPLRRDVDVLGRLLGDVLAEQAGPEALALEERVRRLAIERRRGPRERRKDAATELASLLAELPLDRAVMIIRAFSVYFRLVNIAEQHHRIRRARAHARQRAAPPQRGSLAAVLLAARDAGVTADVARRALRTLEVTLTLTAHPTQAERRTVLEKLHRVALWLEDRDRSRHTPHEREDARSAVREEITALWQTDEVRRERPTVGDEVKNVLWYVEEILWAVLPELSHELARAFERAYREPLGFERIPVRIHSWVGGDMDGNPLVTPDVVEAAMQLHRTRALERILAEVGRLGAALSQSERWVRVAPELTASLESDGRRMPAVRARQEPRSEGEPWRRKLSFIEARLRATLAGGPIGEGEGEPYAGPAELERDLELIARTLRSAGASGAGERRAVALLERVRAFGFSIAELELRALAADARERERGQGGARLLDALRRVAAAQRTGGESACRTLILSMAEGPEDVLAALDAARSAGLWREERGAASIDIVPLFETFEALEASPETLRALLENPVYRRHLDARGVQEVMVGYSDSNKEVGLLAASAALRRAEEGLLRVAREAGIALRLFHGRGESVARGGGPAQQAILALPPGTVGGRYKATEQGEALDQKYGRPELAMRTLELAVGGAILHTLGAEERPSADDEARFVAAFDELAEIGRRTYRALVWEEPLFAEFFAAATPIEEIGALPLGSRPVKRKAGGIEALRAIPWVFAWTQNRAILPGWYGIGTALAEVGSRPGGEALLTAMYRRWPFFRAVLDNVEMVLAKTDLAIAARYARLAPAPARRAVWRRIRDEHRAARTWIRRLHGERRLLENNPTLRRSILLRNPYVDPMSFLQVELLRRERAGDAGCARPILLTLNGIAGGMRNVG